MKLAPELKVSPPPQKRLQCSISCCRQISKQCNHHRQIVKTKTDKHETCPGIKSFSPAPKTPTMYVAFPAVDRFLNSATTTGPLKNAALFYGVLNLDTMPHKVPNDFRFLSEVVSTFFLRVPRMRRRSRARVELLPWARVRGGLGRRPSRDW